MRRIFDGCGLYLQPAYFMDTREMFCQLRQSRELIRQAARDREPSYRDRRYLVVTNAIVELFWRRVGVPKSLDVVFLEKLH